MEIRLGLALDRNAAADGEHGSGVRRPLQRRQIQPDQCADRPQRAGAHLAYAGPHPGTDLLRRPRQCRASTGRHARLRLRLGAENQGRVLDQADPSIPARTRHPGAGLCADRRPPRHQGRRPGRAEDAGQVGGQLSGGDDQGRPGQAGRIAEAYRGNYRSPGQASGRVSGNPGDVVEERRRHARTARGDGAPAGERS